MKKLICFLFVFSISTYSCNKEESPKISFNPTEFIIRDMGAQMHLGIRVPTNGYHNFLADSSTFNSYGEGFLNHLVPPEEMENLAINLSDTVIFKWVFVTAVSPYQEDECELHAACKGYGAFMCSIGKGNTASGIIRELSKSVTGEVNEVFNDIAILLSE